jgi:pimeloyl-ACP methyl ester carboxylesterase
MDFIFGLILTVFTFNLDPMGPAKKDIQIFKQEYASHIKSYQGEYRKMSFAENGSTIKRPLLFIHGSPGSQEAWYSFLLDSQLLEKFHMISVDRPGYGGSGLGETEISVKKQTDDIWKVLQFNHSQKKPIILGHSYGGAIVARLAMDHPNEIHAVIFVASSVDPQLEKKEFIQFIGNLWGVRSIIPKAIRVCNEEIIALKKDLEDMLPLWPLIKTPVAIIHGDKDQLVPVANVAFMQEKLPPNVIKKITIIKGMNHFIPWQKPDVIKKILLEWDSP